MIERVIPTRCLQALIPDIQSQTKPHQRTLQHVLPLHFGQAPKTPHQKVVVVDVVGTRNRKLMFTIIQDPKLRSNRPKRVEEEEIRPSGAKFKSGDITFEKDIIEGGSC